MRHTEKSLQRSCHRTRRKVKLDSDPEPQENVVRHLISDDVKLITFGRNLCRNKFAKLTATKIV